MDDEPVSIGLPPRRVRKDAYDEVVVAPDASTSLRGVGVHLACREVDPGTARQRIDHEAIPARAREASTLDRDPPLAGV
ncbi:MAG TPA: hypothetical protein VF422_08695, partial [Dokdonella sp.]